MVVEKFGGLLPNNTLAENTLVDWLLPQQINKDKNCWKIKHGGLVVKHQIKSITVFYHQNLYHIVCTQLVTTMCTVKLTNK